MSGSGPSGQDRSAGSSRESIRTICANLGVSRTGTSNILKELDAQPEGERTRHVLSVIQGLSEQVRDQLLAAEKLPDKEQLIRELQQQLADAAVAHQQEKEQWQQQEQLFRQEIAERVAVAELRQQMQQLTEQVHDLAQSNSINNTPRATCSPEQSMAASTAQPVNTVGTWPFYSSAPEPPAYYTGANSNPFISSGGFEQYSYGPSNSYGASYVSVPAYQPGSYYGSGSSMPWSSHAAAVCPWPSGPQPLSFPTAMSVASCYNTSYGMMPPALWTHTSSSYSAVPPVAPVYSSSGSSTSIGRPTPPVLFTAPGLTASVTRGLTYKEVKDRIPECTDKMAPNVFFCHVKQQLAGYHLEGCSVPNICSLIHSRIKGKHAARVEQYIDFARYKSVEEYITALEAEFQPRQEAFYTALMAARQQPDVSYVKHLDNIKKLMSEHYMPQPEKLSDPMFPQLAHSFRVPYEVFTQVQMVKAACVADNKPAEALKAMALLQVACEQLDRGWKPPSRPRNQQDAPAYQRQQQQHAVPPPQYQQQQYQPPPHVNAGQPPHQQRWWQHRRHDGQPHPPRGRPDTPPTPRGAEDPMQPQVNSISIAAVGASQQLEPPLLSLSGSVVVADSPAPSSSAQLSPDQPGSPQPNPAAAHTSSSSSSSSGTTVTTVVAHTPHTLPLQARLGVNAGRPTRRPHNAEPQVPGAEPAAQPQPPATLQPPAVAAPASRHSSSTTVARQAAERIGRAPVTMTVAHLVAVFADPRWHQAATAVRDYLAQHGQVDPAAMAPEQLANAYAELVNSGQLLEPPAAIRSGNISGSTPDSNMSSSFCMGSSGGSCAQAGNNSRTTGGDSTCSSNSSCSSSSGSSKASSNGPASSGSSSINCDAGGSSQAGVSSRTAAGSSSSSSGSQAAHPFPPLLGICQHSVPPQQQPSGDYRAAVNTVSLITVSMPYIKAYAGGKPDESCSIKMHQDTGSGVSCISDTAWERDRRKLLGPHTQLVAIEPITIGLFDKRQFVQVHLLVKRALITIGKATYEFDLLVVPEASVDYLLGDNDVVLKHITLSPAEHRARVGLQRALVLHRPLPQRPHWAGASWVPTQPVKLYWSAVKLRLRAKDHGF